MKTRRIFTAVFLSICMVFTNVMTVYAMPPMPSSFWGSVYVNGVTPPAGTVVSAWINGVQYAYATGTLNSGVMYYGLNVPGDDPETEEVIEGGIQGNTIIFKIGDLVADQTGVWRTGTNANINLTATQLFQPVITEGDTVTETMSEDGAPATFDLTLNATDANGDTITWSISTPAGHGTASASGTNR